MSYKVRCTCDTVNKGLLPKSHEIDHLSEEYFSTFEDALREIYTTIGHIKVNQIMWRMEERLKPYGDVTDWTIQASENLYRHVLMCRNALGYTMITIYEIIEQ